jgi:hypothetical protein
MGFLNGSGSEHREGKAINLAELAGDNGVIEGFHFEDCHVKGPAVLVMQGDFSLVSNEIEGDPDAYLWEIPEHRTHVIGAILVKDTTFERCYFTKVGLAGRSDFIERLRHDVEVHAANPA